MHILRTYRKYARKEVEEKIKRKQEFSLEEKY